MTRELGTVLAWRKTYGFISCRSLSRGVFVHEGDVLNNAKLAVGDRVVFELSTDDDRGPRAINVKHISPGGER